MFSEILAAMLGLALLLLVAPLLRFIGLLFLVGLIDVLERVLSKVP
jgi:hypothetical protein